MKEEPGNEAAFNTGPKNDNTIDPLLSDFQTIRQHCDQAGRRHYSLP